MPSLFVCPHCGTKTQVDDQFSGHRGRCVACDGEIEVHHFRSDPNATGESGASSSLGNKRFRWVAGTAVCLLLIVGLATLMMRVGRQTMTTLSAGRAKTASIKNLEKIAKALNAYAADHGTYPVPMTVDANKTPMHSWRVLILPYLDEQDLYDQIDLDKPWDDPTNRAMTDYQMPACYSDVTSNTYGQMTSRYYLVTGAGTLFPPAGPLGPDDVLDQPTQTILVTEGMPTQYPMSWTVPIDIDVVNLQSRISSGQGFQTGNMQFEGVTVATVDGRGHYLEAGIAPSTVDALITPAGDERLADDTLD